MNKYLVMYQLDGENLTTNVYATNIHDALDFALRSLGWCACIYKIIQVKKNA